MALALLKLLSFGDDIGRFSIDTGTNPYYTIKIGQGSYKDNAFELLDGVVSETGLRRNEKSSNLLDSDMVVTIPAGRFSDKNCYVQLQTFKDETGRSPAYSKIVKMRTPLRLPQVEQDAYSFSYSKNRFAMYQEPLNAQRNIPFAETSPATSGNKGKDQLLRQLVESASPMVLGLVNGHQQSRSKPGSRLCSAISLLNIILNLFANGANTQRVPAQNGLASATSLAGVRRHRFATSRSKSEPAPGPAAGSGPVMQDSPEDLMIKAIIEQIQKEALLGAFLDNQEGSGGIDVNKLMQLLQQPPATGLPAKTGAANTAPQQVPVQFPNQGLNQGVNQGSNQGSSPSPNQSPQKKSGTSTTPAVPGNSNGNVSANGANASSTSGQISSDSGDLFATPQSLLRRKHSFILSDQSLLAFEPGPLFMVNDKNVSVYKKTDIKFKVRFNVISNAQLANIPRAIVTFTFKGPDDQVVLERVFQKTDVVPGEVMQLDFSEFEVKPLPVGRPVVLTAEIRWPDPANTGVVVKAFGSSSVVFTEGYLPKTAGRLLPGEKELVSMEQYRPFWNKIWESPVGEVIASGPDGYAKKLWSLDIDLMYRIKCCGDKESNGLMHSRMALNEQDTGGVTESFEGKLKSGIELSITELNKLSTLWGKKPLENGQLAAARSSESLSDKFFESIYHVKLKGKMRDRGMVWVVPVLRLQELILSGVSKTDENGQVTEMTDVPVQLPVPSSIRIITLKSN